MNEFKIIKKFDRLVSVEMLEHMRNYEKLFERFSSFLKPEGLFFVHIFTHHRFAYPFEIKDDTDWMSRYFLQADKCLHIIYFYTFKKIFKFKTNGLSMELIMQTRLKLG